MNELQEWFMILKFSQKVRAFGAGVFSDEASGLSAKGNTKVVGFFVQC